MDFITKTLLPLIGKTFLGLVFVIILGISVVFVTILTRIKDYKDIKASMTELTRDIKSIFCDKKRKRRTIIGGIIVVIVAFAISAAVTFMNKKPTLEILHPNSATTQELWDEMNLSWKPVPDTGMYYVVIHPLDKEVYESIAANSFYVPGNTSTVSMTLGHYIYGTGKYELSVSSDVKDSISDSIFLYIVDNQELQTPTYAPTETQIPTPSPTITPAPTSAPVPTSTIQTTTLSSNEMVYYVDKTNNSYIYSMNLDGSNKSVMLQESCSQVLYADSNELAYQTLLFNQDGSWSTIDCFSMNLLTGESEKLPIENNATIISVVDGTIYYEQNGTNYSYNVKNRDKRKIGYRMGWITPAEDVLYYIQIDEDYSLYKKSAITLSDAHMISTTTYAPYIFDGTYVYLVTINWNQLGSSWSYGAPMLLDHKTNSIIPIPGLLDEGVESFVKKIDNKLIFITASGLRTFDLETSEIGILYRGNCEAFYSNEDFVYIHEHEYVGGSRKELGVQAISLR